MKGTFSNSERERMQKMHRVYMKNMYENAPSKAKRSIKMSKELFSLYKKMKQKGQLGEFYRVKQSILMGGNNQVKALLSKINKLETKVTLLESDLILERTKN